MKCCRHTHTHTHHHKQYQVFSHRCAVWCNYYTIWHRVEEGRKEVRLFNIDTHNSIEQRNIALSHCALNTFTTHTHTSTWTRKKEELIINKYAHTPKPKIVPCDRAQRTREKGWKTSEKEVNFVDRESFFFVAFFFTCLSYPSFTNKKAPNRRRKKRMVYREREYSFCHTENTIHTHTHNVI